MILSLPHKRHSPQYFVTVTESVLNSRISYPEKPLRDAYAAYLKAYKGEDADRLSYEEFKGDVGC